MITSQVLEFHSSREQLLDGAVAECREAGIARLAEAPDAAVLRLRNGSVKRVDLWVVREALVVHGLVGDRAQPAQGSLHVGRQSAFLAMGALCEVEGSSEGDTSTAASVGYDNVEDFTDAVVAGRSNAPTAAWVLMRHSQGGVDAVVGTAAGVVPMTSTTDTLLVLHPSRCASAASILIDLLAPM